MKLRVQTEMTERFYYPDVMVTCAEDDTYELYKVAQSLLVEVVSVSTQGVDRREKLQAYQGIPELRALRYRRDNAADWWLHDYRDEGTLELPYLNLNLMLDEIYEGL